jgi:hypothetical protein
MNDVNTSPIWLTDKKLATPPSTWDAWLECWNASNDPLTLAGLLHMGPTMPEPDRMSRSDIEVLGVYLRTARRFWKHEKLPDFDERYEFGNPLKYVASVAFKTLCTHYFAKKEGSRREPCEHFIFVESLLSDVMDFLGADLQNARTDSENPLRSLLVYAGRRSDIIQTFAEQLADTLLRGRRTSHFPSTWPDDEQEALQKCWRMHCRQALAVLLTLKKERVLYNSWEDFDQRAVLAHLKEWIMTHKVYIKGPGWVPPSTLKQVMSAAKSPDWSRKNDHVVAVLDMYHGLGTRMKKT